MKNQNLQIPKTENQKKTLLKKKNLTEWKALVQKDFLICTGSVPFSILLQAKHSTFQSGFPFFSHLHLEASRTSIFLLFCIHRHFLPKFYSFNPTCRISTYLFASTYCSLRQTVFVLLGLTVADGWIHCYKILRHQVRCPCMYTKET